jgi:hypothetical protein
VNCFQFCFNFAFNFDLRHCIPRGFDMPHLFDRHRAVADRWRPRFRALLAAEAGGSLRTGVIIYI